MKFDVPVVKGCLVNKNQVFTVRKYETGSKFSVTDVCDVGSCMVEKIKQVESMADLRGYLKYSGFVTLKQWWDKITQFGAGNGWLYHVTKLEDEFPSPLNDSEAEYAANQPENPVKVIAFTGNRDLRLDQVHDALMNIHHMHPQTTWRTGMAYGLDLAVAQFAADNNIPFEAHLPFPPTVQPARWNAAARNLYDHLLTKASKVFTHSLTFSMRGYQLRNVKMADGADLVVAFTRNKKGGTVNMINHCIKSGIPVIDGFTQLFISPLITTLQEDEVFVFGSNLQGFHGAGSAGYAMRGTTKNDWRNDQNFLDIKSGKNLDKRGKWAVYGVGIGFQEGLEGKSYAVATVERPGVQGCLTEDHLHLQLLNLVKFAVNHPELKFKLVKLGANRSEGGYSYLGLELVNRVWDQIRVSENIPSNIIFPADQGGYN